MLKHSAGNGGSRHLVASLIGVVESCVGRRHLLPLGVGLFGSRALRVPWRFSIIPVQNIRFIL